MIIHKIISQYWIVKDVKDGVSLAYPVERLDWTLFRVVIFFHNWFPLLEKFEDRTLILPRNFTAVFIIFAGRASIPGLLVSRLPRIPDMGVALC